MDGEKQGQRSGEDDEPRTGRGDEQPLDPFGDEDRPQAEPAAGEAPLKHLVTGRFGDTTPDPEAEEVEGSSDPVDPAVEDGRDD